MSSRAATARRLPAFIIGGAVKAATSSIHQMLAAQPGIFIPHGEIYFFDYDDYHEHPYFFSDGRGRWRHLDYETQPSEFVEWYASRFAAAADDDLVGEDSPSYLASVNAPPRIARLLPDVRIVFSLRDPVARAYSQYWYVVARRRIVASFEETLRHDPTILSRGLYREQVQRWLGHLPRTQLHFVLFEEFVADPGRALNDILAFLGRPPVAADEVPVSHEKPSAVPISVGVQLFLNRFLRDVTAMRYAGHLPGGSRPRRSPKLAGSRWLNRLLLRTRRPPPMAADTRAFLRAYYARENAGLDTLIGLPVEERWRD